MENIKVAVVGTGFIGPVHIEALKRIGNVEIVAIADADVEKAKEKARYWNIPNVYSDYKELLKKEKFDVLHNCTPNFLHYQINADVIEAGKHIFSEKPLAMNTQESGKLVELAKKHKVVNALGFNYRFNSLIREIKYRIQNNYLGKIYLVHGSYLQDWLLFDTDYNWRLEPAQSGETRSIGDIGSHWSDMIQYLTGSKIVKVMANLKTIIPVRKKPKKAIETFAGTALKPEDYESKQMVNDDCGFVMFELDNGVSGMFMTSQVSAGRKCYLNFEIDCSEGSIWWNQEKPEEAWIGRRNRTNEILIKDPALMNPEARKYVHAPAGHPEGYLDGAKNLCLCVYDYIKDIKSGKKTIADKPDFPTFQDGHNVMLVCEAILKSSQEKKWVEVRY